MPATISTSAGNYVCRLIKDQKTQFSDNIL